jgi:hypothetical protein
VRTEVTVHSEYLPRHRRHHFLVSACIMLCLALAPSPFSDPQLTKGSNVNCALLERIPHRVVLSRLSLNWFNTNPILILNWEPERPMNLHESSMDSSKLLQILLTGTLSECRSSVLAAELLTRGSGGKTAEACGRAYLFNTDCTLRMRRCDRKFERFN